LKNCQLFFGIFAPPEKCALMGTDSCTNNRKFIFDQNWSKIQILVKNPNFGQKSKFLSKIKILVKNQKFGQKSKFWSKIQILVKTPNFSEFFE